MTRRKSFDSGDPKLDDQAIGIGTRGPVSQLVGSPVRLFPGRAGHRGWLARSARDLPGSCCRVRGAEDRGAQQHACQRLQQVHRVARIEPSSIEDPEERGTDPPRTGRLEWARKQERCRRVGGDERKEAVPETAQLLLPRRLRLGPHVERVEQATRHQVEEVVLVPDVSVERHRRDTELRGEPSETDGIKTVRIGHLQGRVNDRIGRECVSGRSRGLHIPEYTS